MNRSETEKLLEILSDKQKIEITIENGALNKAVRNTLTDCFNYCLNTKNEKANDKIFEIESVIDYLHDELNTGHWSEVPLHTRQYFTCASFIKCIIILKSEEICEAILENCLKCLDIGLLLGAPLDENELLPKSATYLSKLLNDLQKPTNETITCDNASSKRCADNEYYGVFDFIKAREVCVEGCPTLESFNNNYFVPQIPVKVKDCMEHWPASKKWQDVNYLLNIAANRTVPIEIGSNYVETNWSQKLMTFKEFILKHYLSQDAEIGYLAQYNLFEHVTELREDIRVPEYCCLSLDYEHSTDPDVNAWLGPKGTVSPLHFDPKNNFLAQVYGTKLVLLFEPSDTQYLYPHETKMLSNTSQVDPRKQDLQKFPELSKAKMYKCLLEPGEMLFIPAKWWHHVTSLDKSFSVSFWWQ